jgi:predicted regulator of amino acid metabolism with ACT domain
MQDSKCVGRPVDREAVEVMSKVCQQLAQARVNLSEIFKDDPENYFKFREIVFDCESLMAVYCDCAPIRLITGSVDDIMSNLNEE